MDELKSIQKILNKSVAYTAKKDWLYDELSEKDLEYELELDRKNMENEKVQFEKSLYTKDYTKVFEYTSKIKALNTYKLVKDYRENFMKLTQNNTESVWEIQHTNLELGVGNFINQWWASIKFLGYGFAEVTPVYVSVFEPNDPRLKFTVAMNNDPYFGLIYKNSFSSTTYSPRKFLQSNAELTQKADGDIRYNVTMENEAFSIIKFCVLLS